ncbi:MAG: NUDIX hydrolase [Cellvibrionaceae bacterium]
MPWLPHVTVAAIVHKDGKFLMVEEFSKDSVNVTEHKLVINQPAGHLEENETLLQALERETYEETGWKVKPEALLGIRLFKAANKTTYLRVNFLATPIKKDENAILDSDIARVVWMTKEEIASKKESLRSVLVSEAISLYDSGVRYPLSIVNSNLFLQIPTD